jgi:hypothetical protein
MKKLVLALLIVIIACPTVFALGKNLNNLVANGKPIKIYLADFKSCSDKISTDTFKTVFKDTLSARKKENFVIVPDKATADLILNCDIVNYRYLEKDPVDHFVAGTYGLIADALVKQNYVQIQIEFNVYKPASNKRVWRDKCYVSLTQTNMPEPDSIPKVLKESAKRFAYLCFGKSLRQ